MNIPEKIKILAIKNNISVQQLAEKSGQSSANLYNKLARNSFKVSELEKLADAVGCTLEVNFVLPNGEKV